MYHLDPAKFFSAPGLTWDAALKGNVWVVKWYLYAINGCKRD